MVRGKGLETDAGWRIEVARIEMVGGLYDNFFTDIRILRNRM